MREWRNRVRYGLEPGQYAAMLLEQDGRCAICRCPEKVESSNGVAWSLSVDHDHKTGRVRELLCSNCNKAVGHLRDSPSIADSLACYLRKHTEQEPK